MPDLGAFISMLAGAMLLKTAETAGEDIYSKAKEGIENLKAKLSKGKNRDELLNPLVKLENESYILNQKEKKDLEQAIKEANIAGEMEKEIIRFRKIMKIFIDKHFTNNEIDDLVDNLGYQPGELYAPNETKRRKMINLLDKIEKDEKFPEMIKEMIDLKPSILH